MRYKGLGFGEVHTTWSKDGKKLTVPDLTKRLKDLIRRQKNQKIYSRKPDLPSRKRKEAPVIGTISNQRTKLESKSIANEVEFDQSA